MENNSERGEEGRKGRKGYERRGREGRTDIPSAAIVALKVTARLSFLPSM